MLHFFATHEICLITFKAIYVPFSSTSSAHETIVCGPLKESWQIEELQALQDCGWLVHYYADGRLLDGTSAPELEGELDLDNYRCGRVFLDEYTLVIMDDYLEDSSWITEKTEIRAEDEVGIELALLGWT
ncbi:hypothetical protein POX_f07441 [Penicillium oxalicum]|uniref:hypothetical protein n=1 Tax=Penicillium oxalicum TaxID=69781 RepID=UPI0020B7456E|nr:hypothetical protein POX_f07441 [Penicillium oxalicum]KAI2787084.1 hypothetical protein POX_f07441 [Penicillium oxalicum]